MTPFVHLRLHTEYSLVDSTIRIKPLMKVAASKDLPALAITDQNNFFGLNSTKLRWAQASNPSLVLTCC